MARHWPRRTLSAAFGLGLLLCCLGPASAQPPNQGSFMGIVTSVEISGPTEVCTDVAYTYTVEVIRYWLHGVVANTTYVNMGAIPSQVTVDVSGRSSSGRTTVWNGASVPARFASPGTYTLTASAPGADSATAAITAKNCDYQVQTMSIWYHLPFGFKPWVGGITAPVRLHPDASGTYLATSTLSTFAIGSFRCGLDFEVDDPEVTIRGVLRSSGSSLAFSIDYASGTGTATVTCPGAQASSFPAPFSLATISSFLPANPAGGVAVWVEQPHVLTTEGQSNGVTYVILEKLP